MPLIGRRGTPNFDYRYPVVPVVLMASNFTHRAFSWPVPSMPTVRYALKAECLADGLGLDGDQGRRLGL
jgi:hypothetical protein